MQDFHDDGEGGAGIKIMHLLQDSNVRNVLVIVSRWYGGILLGPARFMYITDAARGVLQQGGYLQQPRALALTNTAVDLAPMDESSSSDEEAEVGSSLDHIVASLYNSCTHTVFIMSYSPTILPVTVKTPCYREHLCLDAMTWQHTQQSLWMTSHPSYSISQLSKPEFCSDPAPFHRYQ